MRGVKDLRVSAHGKVAQAAEITALIAEDLAIGAHLLQINHHHAQRWDDFSRQTNRYSFSATLT